MLPVFSIFAFLYTIASFLGLELHVGYQGNAYQVLYPGSFEGDMYLSHFRPHLFSLYYLIVKAVGPLWLDDRFQLLLYFIAVVATLLAIDKMAQVMGLSKMASRWVVLSLMLLEHPMTAAQGGILLGGYSPTTYAFAIGFWFLYFILAGKKVLPTLLLMLVLAGMSPKYSHFPILLGLAIFWNEKCDKRMKIAVAAGFLLLVLGSLLAYTVILRPADGSNSLLFDYMMKNQHLAEANPFMDTLKHNFLFLILFIGSYFIHLPSQKVQKRVRVVATTGLMLWFFGGCYLSWAPDIFKIPYIPALDFTRGLYFAQYVLYIAIAVFALKGLEESKSPKKQILFLTPLLALYFAPFDSHDLKIAYLSMAVGFLTILFFYLKERQLNLRKCYSWVVITLFLTTSFFYTFRSVKRIPYFLFLLSHGIMGDNPSAKWVGLNEYFKEKPPATTVLVLSMRRHILQPEDALAFDGSFRVRSGKPMPFGDTVTLYFNYPLILKHEKRSEDMKRLVHGLQMHDATLFNQGLDGLGYPDYLVFPKAVAAWLAELRHFNYIPQPEIGGFYIARRI